MVKNKIVGLVVAGGKSLRMGDQDKLLLELGGKTLLARAAHRLSKQVGSTIININHSYEMNDFETIPDTIGDYAGPLAGILSGLEHIRKTYPDVTYMMSVPADAPFFPMDLVQALSSKADQSNIILPEINGHTQQLFTLWPICCMRDLRKFLESGENPKVMNFVKSQNWQKIELDYADVQFLNVNTPEDWSRAREIFKEGRYE